MIEPGLFPIGGGVAVAAGIHQRIFMGIVRTVTGGAIGRRVPVLDLRLVAVAAGRQRMFADQLEIGERVIETTLIEIDDVGVPALVFRMTIGAVPAPGLVVLPMKARSCIDIESDCFVTVEAKCSLLFTFEVLVAVAALGLVLGVPLNELTRHYQRLELCTRACW